MASPSTDTNAGRAVLAKDPQLHGSLGLAISEAVEDAATRDDTKYSLGTVLNHVLLHQTVIGQEAMKQMEKAGEYPDVVIGCVGGGSNFAGIAFPFVREKLQGKKMRFVAVEPEACPTLTRGVYAFDYGDTAEMAPVVKMYTLGHNFMPAGIHAGGLRYHGMSPLVSLLYDQKVIEAVAYHQNPVFDAGAAVRPHRGHHAGAGVGPRHPRRHRRGAALQDARARKETILFNLSGHGHFDMAAYDQYLDGKLEDYAYPAEKVKEALDELPKVSF